MNVVYYNDLEIGDILMHLPTGVEYRVSKVYDENKMVVLKPIIDFHMEDMVLKKEEVLRELFSREVSWVKEIELELKNKRIEEANKAMRFNDGKLKWSLVHFKSLEPMVKVLMFGAKKYDAHNWKKGLDRDEILESMMRHLAAIIDGEENDPESGISHMGHIMCNAMFYQYHHGKSKTNQNLND